jgi:hypothetical protein
VVLVFPLIGFLDLVLFFGFLVIFGLIALISIFDIVDIGLVESVSEIKIDGVDCVVLTADFIKVDDLF